MSSPAAPPLVAGDPARLGPYRLLGRLGHGASGIVYLGEQGGRLAAVKALRAELAVEPGRERVAGRGGGRAEVVAADREGAARITVYTAGDSSERTLARARFDPPDPARPGRLDAYCAADASGTHLVLELAGRRLVAADLPPDGAGDHDMDAKLGILSLTDGRMFAATFDKYALWWAP